MKMSKEYCREYRKKNRAKLLAYQRAWRLAHPNRHREYYWANREKRLEQAKRFYLKNRVAILARQKAHYHQNRVDILACRRIKGLK